MSNRSTPHWAFVSPADRSALRRRYFHLAQCESFLLLDAYCLSSLRIEGDHAGEPDPYVQIPRDVLNACRGLKADASDTASFLAEYASANGLDATALETGDDGSCDAEADFYSHVFKGTNHSDNRVRCMTVRHLVAAGLVVSIKSKWKRLGFQEKVHVVTGDPQSKSSLTDGRYSVQSDQRLIVRYFEKRTHPQRYACTEQAMDAAEDWVEANLNPYHQDCEYRQFRIASWAYPRPLPSKKGSTCRLFEEMGWQCMRSQVRRLLKPEWVELDLSAAYLAIWLRVLEDHGLAHHARLLAEVVGEDGTGAWGRALTALEAPQNATKAQIKSAVYALLFGGSKATCERELTVAGVKDSDAFRIINSPLARELRRTLRLLSGWRRNNGFLWDAYGTRCRGTAKNDTSLIALVGSSWELRLVARAYEAAGNAAPGAYIAVHSHDGISVGHDEVVCLAGWVRRLQDAVNSEAADLGVRTRFVVAGGDSTQREAA